MSDGGAIVNCSFCQMLGHNVDDYFGFCSFSRLFWEVIWRAIEAEIFNGKLCWEEFRGERLSIAMVDYLPLVYIEYAAGMRFLMANSVLGLAGHCY